MTYSDLLSVLGAFTGVAVLVVMAVVPLLVELPLPRRRAPLPLAPVMVPVRRRPAPAARPHSSAA